MGYNNVRACTIKRNHIMTHAVIIHINVMNPSMRISIAILNKFLSDQIQIRIFLHITHNLLHLTIRE